MNHTGTLWKRLMPLILMLLAWCTPALGLDVNLQWDANTETDLAGYKVYYKTATPGPSYNGTGAVEGDSPIDVGNVTQITLHGLDEDVTYFFAVTAYNTSQLESGFSNEASTADDNNGGSSRDGSGGGGGCFTTVVSSIGLPDF